GDCVHAAQIAMVAYEVAQEPAGDLGALGSFAPFHLLNCGIEGVRGNFSVFFQQRFNALALAARNQRILELLRVDWRAVLSKEWDRFIRSDYVVHYLFFFKLLDPGVQQSALRSSLTSAFVGRAATEEFLCVFRVAEQSVGGGIALSIELRKL